MSVSDETAIIILLALINFIAIYRKSQLMGGVIFLVLAFVSWYITGLAAAIHVVFIIIAVAIIIYSLVQPTSTQGGLPRNL